MPAACIPRTQWLAAGFVILRTLILCLYAETCILVQLISRPPPANPDVADPFGTFISVQTVRKMREQQNSESD